MHTSGMILGAIFSQLPGQMVVFYLTALFILLLVLVLVFIIVMIRRKDAGE